MAKLKIEAKKKKSNAGRKSKYESNVEPRLNEIAHWARDGLIEEEMCKRLGIGLTAFNEYKTKYPKLKNALKLNREIADYRVTDSLYEATQGYYKEEITKERVVMTDERGQPVLNQFGAIQYELKVTRIVNKYYPPNMTAVAYWLNNRVPEKWKQRQESNINISGIKKLEDFMSDDENG